MTEPLHIVSFQAKNFLGLKVARITPGGDPIVVLGGPNGAGKSSVFAAIKAAFGGKGALPPAPIRRGKSRAEVIVDCKDLRVELVVTGAGPQIVVKDGAGVVQRRPQEVLNKFWSKVSFDPMEIDRKEAKEQDKLLKQVLGLDFTEYDARYDKTYKLRTQINHDVDRLEKLLEAAPAEHEDAPAEEVSVRELLDELERRERGAKHGEALEREATRAEDHETSCRVDATNLESDIAELEKRLSAARTRLDELRKAAELARVDAEKARGAADNYTSDDPAEIKAQLATVELTNAKVRQNAARKKLEAELEVARGQADDCTDTLKTIDEMKQEKLAAADFPIEGLGFDEEWGPTMDGLPLKQANTAKRLKLYTAISAQLNPELRVVLLDGNGWAALDRKGREDYTKFCADRNLQVWLELVTDTGEGATVFLEDGETREAPSAGKNGTSKAAPPAPVEGDPETVIT